MTQAPDALAQALAAARRGDLAQARRIAEQGLADAQGDPVALHAFLGMVHAREGDRAAAAAHLASAHRAKPADVTIACNLIAILLEDGREAEALDIASPALARSDASLRVARYRGFLSQQLERFADAVEAYELVLANAPRDFEAWNNLGNARAALGDQAGAVAALRRAVALDPDAAPTRLNLASALLALDRPDEAIEALEQAERDFPDDPRPSYHLYVACKALARQDAALAALERAAARDPDDAAIQLKLGVEYGVMRRTGDAERAYLRAIARDPGAVDAYLGLAIQYEHMNRGAEFAPLCARARENGLPEGPVAFIEALELRRDGRFAEALARLDAVPADLEPVRTVHLRATLLDRMDRADAAFAAYAEANRLMATGSDALARGAGLRAELETEVARLTPAWRESWRDCRVEDDRPDPVFLIGFPRSGTTLLDTILMGHSGTVVMEEQPPLNIVHEDIGGMAAIPAMDAAAAARARDRYFAEVAKVADAAPGRLLIDKSPLFLYKLPLIRRLFPNARIILALRHPCDVVLSCLMSNFRLNSAMSNFLRLEDAAAFYDLAFRHWAAATELFALPGRTVIYERLVEDVEAEVRPLFAWLGLDWRDEALDHQRTARARGLITTASYAQVAEPIYRRASGRWRRYRRHLEPVLPVLAPWIERFGYTD